MSDRRTALSGRCPRLSARNVDALVTALALPVMLMLMFVYLFGGAIDTGAAYVDLRRPRRPAAVRRLRRGDDGRRASPHDLTERHRRPVPLDGRRRRGVPHRHVVASVARNAASTPLVFGVALAIGFRPTPAPLAGSRRSGSCAVRARALVVRGRARPARGRPRPRAA